MLIACPSCQRQLNVPDNAAGKQVRCPAPDCGTIFTVSVQPVPAAKAAPLKPIPIPAAPRPQPSTAGAPFDFGGGGVVGPEADFGFTESTDGGLKGIGLRTRVNRAAGWLNLSAGSMVLFALFAIVLPIAAAVVTRNWALLAGAACAPFVLLPFPILIVIGARMLSRTRRWGMALTAAILSLAVGVLSLLDMFGFGIWAALLVFGVGSGAAQGPAAEFVKYLLILSCSTTALSAAVAFCGIFAGFVAMRTLMNAEIKKSFT